MSAERNEAVMRRYENLWNRMKVEIDMPGPGAPRGAPGPGMSSAAKWAIGLLVVVAALVVGAGAGIPDAEAKKKKVNVVRCADVGFECVGTDGRDRLVGTAGSESIFGEGGKDVYEANGGNTSLTDRSAKSSDSYTAVDPGPGRNTIITDSGGSADFLDMGSFGTDDVAFIRLGDELVLEGAELRRVRITGHFGGGRIEEIRFADETVEGAEVETLATEASAQERATLGGGLDEHVPRRKE